ncbi:tetratricopeptide repeat protein [Tumebacillus sp. BK434]|uniref:helix-turn-helix transcriptional regulator n=1 Tax=Tumebacillus sp. BK434 TaxID=2512169 RepID=UPI0010463962|nr:helix-turn-helix transcriptional regulator [Tumebacillus sp. BK434]TCP59121.1 tetratricopeptide repeat protein [Tumebacillus sp. BK434]
MHSLGQRIREKRMKKGLTQIELASGICTPSLISQIESDRARPSYKTLLALTTRLDVPLEHLLKEVNLDLEYSSKYKMTMGLVRAKEFETAIPLLNDLLEIQQQRVPKEELLLELSQCHIEMGNALESECVLNQLYQICNSERNGHLLAEVLLQLGKVAALKNEYPIALFHTSRAWDELQKFEENDVDIQAKILMQLASLNERVGKAAEAVTYYEKALLLNQCNGEDRGKAFLRLAQVYDRQKKYEHAEEYAMKATVLLEEQVNEEQKREMHHRLIMLQREKNAWKMSVQKLLNIAEGYEQIDDKSKAGEVFADIALICAENGEFEESWAYAEKARMSLSETSPTMGQVHRVLSVVYFHRDDEEKGKRHLDNAAKIYERHGKFTELEEVTFRMCRYLGDKGEHREAFERMGRFHQFMREQLEQRGIVL